MVAKGNDGLAEEASIRMIEDLCTIDINKSTADRNGENWITRSNRNSSFQIEVNDLSYSVTTGRGKKKDVLHSISCLFRPGKLSVIIGPSGAGKTTLLSTICHLRSSTVKGSITVNGEQIDHDTFRKEICYIPQNFDLLPLLTVRETLYIAARLKLGRSKRIQNPHLVVNEIAAGLGLVACLDTLAGNLSGGERKRLSIGVEIVMKPSVMLLDEPTSGLDSAASYQVINLIHRMAQAGCTVVCAIHQPSSQMISQFDDIMVLSKGKCMYCGPKEEILNAFATAGYACPQFYNIAEFVLEVITEQRTGDLEALRKNNFEIYSKWKMEPEEEIIDDQQVTNDDPTIKYFKGKGKKEYANDYRPLSGCQQQKVLLLRAMMCIKRDSTLTKLRFAAHVTVAILLGTVFYDFGNDASKVYSNIACLFFFLLFLFFANSMPAVQMFPIEAAVFLREHLNNWYRLSSYYIVKVVSDLPMQIMCASCFFLIAYYLTGQPMDVHRLWKGWLVCVLMTILGQSAGMATGAAFNTQIGVFLIPACSIPMLLFAGFFLKLKEIAIYFQPLSVISFFRYAYEGLVQAVYDNDRANLECPEVYCLFKMPKKLLNAIDMPSVAFHTIIASLMAWILFIHIIIYSVLKWKLYCASK